jgi:hypothetical protein
MDVREGAPCVWVCRGLYSVPSDIGINCIHFYRSRRDTVSPKENMGGPSQCTLDCSQPLIHLRYRPAPSLWLAHSKNTSLS